MRRMGIDPGQRRTGLALCEEGLSVAVPIRTVEHKTLTEAVSRVAEAIVEAEVAEVIVGLPLRLDGSEGQAARRVRTFVEALQQHIEAPVVMWDERLSTVAAERALAEQGVSGRARRKVVDQAAATIMLQSYLDAQVGTWQEGPIDEIPGPEPLVETERGSKRNRRQKTRSRRGR